jgi:Zn-dependent oligopeptidase
MTDHTLQDNPLLDFSGLPRFDVLTPADVQPAISALLARCRALIERKLTRRRPRRDLGDFAAPLADGFEQLSRAWGMVGHVHSVNDVPPGGTPTTACCLKSHASMPKSARTCKLFDKYKAIAEAANTHACRWRSSESSNTRFAIFAWRERSCQRRQTALPGDQRGTRTALGKVLGESARRHQRLCRTADRRERTRRTA